MTTEREAVRHARIAWRRADREVTRVQVVYEECEALLEQIERGVEENEERVLAAISRFGRPPENPTDRRRRTTGGTAQSIENRRSELGYLEEPLLQRDDQQVSAIRLVRQEQTLDEPTAAAFDRLEAYLSSEDVPWDGSSDSVLAAFETVVRDDVPRSESLLRIEAVVLLFDLAQEAARVNRDHRSADLESALESYVDGIDGLPDDIAGQPIALLPIRLETRFVRPGEDGTPVSHGSPTELRVRVYPDQIHLDSHEPELTEDEVAWGHNFWTAVWYASHPQLPERADHAGGDQAASLEAYYADRLPEDRLRAVIDGIDPDGYSAPPPQSARIDRYNEIKTRAWGQLLDRFGRERAAYVVHATAPEDPPDADGRFSDDLLRPPAADATGHERPPLRFPDVPRRPSSWTKQPRARLLPDRWIAVVRWRTAGGAERSETILGDRIREPLPAGPGPELTASVPAEPDGDEPSQPDGVAWITDYERAEAAGMAFSVPGDSRTLDDLNGFDPERGFTRVVVFGVRTSSIPVEGSDELRGLLDAHHYTDGLALHTPGTPTNVHDEDTGYATGKDPETSVAIECGPRLVEDRTDGDLLARALGVDGNATGNGHDPPNETGDAVDHVFDHVENADATSQRDARHANTVLWPATLGYFAQHMLLQWSGPILFGDSHFGGDSPPLSPEARLQLFDAYRQHFVRYVRARGPFPTIRTGQQPYGVLPVAPIAAEADRRRETERDRSPVVGEGDDLRRELRDELTARGVSVEPGMALDELIYPGIPVERYLESGFDPSALYYAGVSAAALFEADIPLDSLAELGAEPAQLRDVAPVSDLRDAGYEVDELLDAGYPVEMLAEAGVPASDLVRAGVSVAALLDAYDAPTVVQAGGSVDALLDAGISPDVLAAHGVPLSTLRARDVPAETLRSTGRTAGELRRAGYPASDLRDAGFGAASLLNAGFDEETLATVGFRAAALRDVERPTILTTDVDPAALRLAGYGLATLRETGFDAGRLLDAGFAVSTLVEEGVDIEQLREAGVPISKLRVAGASATALHRAGASPEELRSAGYRAREVREIEVSAADLVEARYSTADLRDAGFTATDLVEAGVSVGALKRRGYSAKSLVTAGVEVEFLRKVGFSAGALAAAGIGRDRLLEAGYLPGELVAVRFPLFDPPAQYGRTIQAPPQFAMRATYGFSFDPALPPDGTEGSTAAEPTLQWRANARDHQLHDQVAGFISGVRPRWDGAVDGLEWVDRDGQLRTYDENTLSAILSRRAVSGSLRLQGWFRLFRWSDGGTPLHSIQTRHHSGVRSALSEVGLDDLNPRLARLLFDGTISTEVYSRYLVGEGDGTFLELLANEPVETIRRLSYRLDPDDFLHVAELDVDARTVREVDWDSLSPDQRERVVRRAFVESLPEESRRYFDEEGRLDPDAVRRESGGEGVDRIGQAESVSRELLRASLGAGASASVEKFVTSLALASKYDDDPTLLRSVLRLLAQFGTLGAYLAGHDRLAHVFGSGADVGPEPTDYDVGDPSRFDPLFEALPDALVEHDQSPATLEAGDSYADLLFEAATGDDDVSALYPRIDEVTNSLEQLATRDRDTLRTLLRETLDLGSHRLDAWWTSLATKRLLELREIQANGVREIETDHDDQHHPHLFGRLANDPDAPPELRDSPSLDDVLTGVGAVDSDPGLYIGAYGFVEDLRVDPDTARPEYIHAPSQQHATTAAVLRSAHQAHEDGEGKLSEAVAVDLSADRVREAKRLIDGVRQGQPLSALLGYRFERRLYEYSDTEVNLMQYERTFRRLFPAQQTGVGGEDGDSPTHGEMAGTTVVDGRALAETWPLSPADLADFPPERAALAADLPQRDVPADSEAIRRIDDIVAELEDVLDAVSDLLLAESVHQLCQNNFEAAGASLDALANGEVPPELTVTQTPRSAVGITHRTMVFLDDPEAATVPPSWNPDRSITVPRLLSDGARPAETPVTESIPLEARADGEPALNAWLGARFPPADEVAYTVTYRWEPDNSVTTVRTLSDLDFSPLDALFASEPGQRAGQSELEQRIAYTATRNRPEHDPQIPPDADLEVTFQATPGEEIPEDAVSVADVLELARSFRDLIAAVRPADADDCTHQTTASDPGYTAETVERGPNATARSLLARADDAQHGLETVHAQLADRIDVLAPTQPPDEGSSIGGESGPDDPSTGNGTVPAVTATETAAAPGITDQVERLLGALNAFDEEVPVTALEAAAAAVDPAAMLHELDDLRQELSPGPLRAADANERVVVRPLEGQSITGELPAAEPTGPDDAEPTPLPEEVTVHVWSTSPVEWFASSAVAPVESDSSFDASIDFSAAEPGVQFQYAVTADGRVLHNGLGRVVTDDDAPPSDPAATVEAAENLGHLLRLASYRTPFRTTSLSESGGPPDADGGAAHRAGGDVPSAPRTAGQRVVDALADLDWETMTRERDVAAEARDENPEISRPDIETLDALVEVQDLDLPGANASLEAIVRPLEALGVPDAVDLIDATGDRRAFVAPEQATNVKVRTERALSNPARLREQAPSLLPFDPAFASILEEVARTTDGNQTRIVAAVEELLERPDRLLAALGEQVDEPHTFCRQLTALAYHAAAFDDETTPEQFAARLDAVADAFDLFGVPVVEDGDSTDQGERLKETLRALAAELRERDQAGGPDGPDPDDQRQSLIESVEDDLERLVADLDAVEAVIRPLQASEPLESVRRGVLEALRAVLVRASYYGVYGSTPESSVGASKTDEEHLLSQARAVSARIAERLDTARALAPSDEDASGKPLTERVTDQRTRLETLFDDAFVVLPPFEPANATELRWTFEDERHLDDPLAAETVLQRISHVRDRPASLREALSYSEAIGETLRPRFRVGQLPYRDEDDTWVGVDAEPDPGRLSLIAQFDLDGSTSTIESTPITGLFVDEWVEDLPSREETTGLSLNYDDPGVRPPQSILVAVPPIDGPWSVDAIEETVDETMAFMKYRTVDLGDLADQQGLNHLLPALTFPRNSNEKPDTASVDFDMLGRYNVGAVRPFLRWYANAVHAVDVERVGRGGGDGS